MPFIDVRLSVSISNKDELQEKLSLAVSNCFSKPSSYIMSAIQDNCDLWMGNKKALKGGYIAISSLGTINKNACNDLSKQICEILTNDYGIEPSNLYITYHPTELWSFRGMMF